jgi:hypothetical protein
MASLLPREVWHLIVAKLDMRCRSHLRATCTFLHQVVSASVTTLWLPRDVAVRKLTAPVLESVMALARDGLQELVIVASSLSGVVPMACLRQCEGLRRFRFRSCSLSNASIALGLAQLLSDATVWPLLEELDVRGAGLDYWLGAIARARPGLKTFQVGCDFEENYSEHDELPRAVRGALSSSSFESARLTSICAVLPRLTKLTSMRCIIPDALPSDAAARLVSLSLKFEDLRFASLPPLRATEELNLRGSHFPLTLFDGAARLRRVDVSCSNCSPLALSSLLDAAPALESLDMCYAGPLVAQGRLVCRLLVDRPASARLKMLGLGGFKEAMTEATFLALLRACPLLEHLGIGSCNQLSAEALLQLGPLCPRMENLNAHRLALDEAEWTQVISSLPRLRELDVSRSLELHSAEFKNSVKERFRPEAPFDW